MRYIITSLVFLYIFISLPKEIALLYMASIAAINRMFQCSVYKNSFRPRAHASRNEIWETDTDR